MSEIDMEQAREDFAAKVAEFEQSEPGPAPDSTLLQRIDAAHAATDANGKRLYEDAGYRSTVEAARVAAFSGRPAHEVEQILSGINTPTPPQPADGGGEWAETLSMPEYGEFRAPDGIQMDQSIVREYAAVAQAAGVSPQQFQTMLENYAKSVA
ncbi:MAG: hypothetical protein AAF394_09840 [Planctomycetota bacterium]